MCKCFHKLPLPLCLTVSLSQSKKCDQTAWMCQEDTVESEYLEVPLLWGSHVPGPPEYSFLQLRSGAYLIAVFQIKLFPFIIWKLERQIWEINFDNENVVVLKLFWYFWVDDWNKFPDWGVSDRHNHCVCRCIKYLTSVCLYCVCFHFYF